MTNALWQMHNRSITTSIQQRLQVCCLKHILWFPAEATVVCFIWSENWEPTRLNKSKICYIQKLKGRGHHSIAHTGRDQQVISGKTTTEYMSQAPFNPISNPHPHFQRHYVRRGEETELLIAVESVKIQQNMSSPSFLPKLFLFPNVQMATAVCWAAWEITATGEAF